MAQTFTKEMARNIFYGGTAFFFLLFLALTFDTHSSLPDRDRREVLESELGPTIALAERGMPVDWFTTLNIALEMNKLRGDAAAASVYLPDGMPPVPETHRPLGNLDGQGRQ